tara:strand:- start:1589 stop:2035 length:447 start_codon:yes stop_codon:yes gene_type:complete
MSRSIAPGMPSLSPSSFTQVGKANRAQVTPAKRVSPVDRSQVSPELVKAAEGMETMFINHLMKTMRKTIPKNEMDLENHATKIYRGMLDSEYSKVAARNNGIGLADQIIAHMTPNRYTESGSPTTPAPKTRTGGTYEGQSKPTDLKSK